MSLAERLLIARLIERDEQAFGEIVRQYGDKVFSLIYRMLGNRQEAEDVAQDVFITVFKTIDSFRGEAKFSTWLLRIAANHAKNRIKYLARRPTRRGRPRRRLARCGVSNDRPGPPVQSQIESPDKLLEAAEMRTAHAARRSPPSTRTSACWSSCATSRSCPTRRSGRSPGLPEGTIKSRLHRARMAIKEVAG